MYAERGAGNGPEIRTKVFRCPESKISDKRYLDHIFVTLLAVAVDDTTRYETNWNGAAADVGGGNDRQIRQRNSLNDDSGAMCGMWSRAIGSVCECARVCLRRPVERWTDRRTGGRTDRSFPPCTESRKAKTVSDAGVGRNNPSRCLSCSAASPPRSV